MRAALIFQTHTMDSLALLSTLKQQRMKIGLTLGEVNCSGSIENVTFTDRLIKRKVLNAPYPPELRP